MLVEFSNSTVNTGTVLLNSLSSHLLYKMAFPFPEVEDVQAHRVMFRDFLRKQRYPSRNMNLADSLLHN